MGITIETKNVTAEWKRRVRRIEIIAENDTPMLDRTILLEVEDVYVVDGITISHKFVKNVQRKLGDLVDLVDPYGTTAMQAMTMLLWDNDVQAQAVSDAILNPPVEESPIVTPEEPIIETPIEEPEGGAV